MNIKITGHHVDITDALRGHVEEKIGRVKGIFPNITNVHVILTVDKFRQKAEARLNLARGEIFADCEDENMYAAVDKLADKVERQVIKHKEKLNNHGNGSELI